MNKSDFKLKANTLNKRGRVPREFVPLPVHVTFHKSLYSLRSSKATQESATLSASKTFLRTVLIKYSSSPNFLSKLSSIPVLLQICHTSCSYTYLAFSFEWSSVKTNSWVLLTGFSCPWFRWSLAAFCAAIRLLVSIKYKQITVSKK